MQAGSAASGGGARKESDGLWQGLFHLPVVEPNTPGDDLLLRQSDERGVDLEFSPFGAGRPITVGWMKGRSRAYAITSPRRPANSAISIVFNDRCDMIVATAVAPHDRPAMIEPNVMAFLNSRTVLHWAELALGI